MLCIPLVPSVWLVKVEARNSCALIMRRQLRIKRLLLLHAHRDVIISTIIGPWLT